MKKFLLGALVCVLVVGGSLTVMAFRFEEVIRPNTYVGIVAVGGLSKQAAAKKLRVWWETEKLRELSVRVDGSKKEPMNVRLSKLGIKLDDQASVAELPLDTFGDSLKRKIQSTDEPKQEFDVKFVKIDGDFETLTQYVQKAIGDPRPARVTFAEGIITREPEVSGYELNETALHDVVVEALKGDGAVVLPIEEAPKRVPDDQLSQITEVMAEFSTKFPTSQVSRCGNLKLASSKLDGTILMPGETFSFNDTVGQRTLKAGYKLAGVYVNGRHDTGIGGGICQVSTTLYNAVLFSNLKIVERTNHSMPVAYVPVGRDATVDWGTKDFRFQNTLSYPIAISSSYAPGKLTFRVLGQKDHSLEIKIVGEGHKSWSRGVKYVDDATVPAGTEKVIEKGSAGHQIVMYRILLRDGVQIEKQKLGTSYYGGGVKIIARNEKAVVPKSTTAGAVAGSVNPSEDED
ncbi:MAG: VanW family protein [Fimbriimonadaceae bacterium]|nr:VanW family protein [Fimbriimonadaceae bacterium]